MTETEQPKDGLLLVREGLVIPRSELLFRATRAGGPGGQHVNTSSTRVELLWNIAHTKVITDEERARLHEKLGKRVDSEGWFRVVASASRSQYRNRIIAEEQLVEAIRKGLAVPRKRRATKPGAGAKEARLREKKLHSRKKQDRRTGGED